MKLSTRTLYGLKAILVLAARFGEGSLSVSQIAKSQGISVAYLEQILNALKKKGFVKSVRGPQGGYVLTKNPSDMDLASLFYALEGNDFLEIKPKDKNTPKADEISIANDLFWTRFQTAFRKSLSGIHFKALLDEARQIHKRQSKTSSQTFHI